MTERELQTVKLTKSEWKRLRGTKYNPDNEVQVRIEMGTRAIGKPNRPDYTDIFENGIRIGGTIYPDEKRKTPE